MTISSCTRKTVCVSTIWCPQVPLTSKNSQYLDFNVVQTFKKNEKVKLQNENLDWLQHLNRSYQDLWLVVEMLELNCGTDDLGQVSPIQWSD